MSRSSRDILTEIANTPITDTAYKVLKREYYVAMERESLGDAGEAPGRFYEMSHDEVKKRLSQSTNAYLKPDCPADWILEQSQAVLVERGKHYTKGKERNWARIAQVFNVLTGRDLTCKEALLFMVAMKLVRATGDPHFNLDHYVDGVNYLALAGEEAAKGE